MAKKTMVIVPGTIDTLRNQAQGGVEQPVTTEQAAAVNKEEKSNVTEDEQLDFNGYLKKYTGIKEQGVAVWISKDIKKELMNIRNNASENIPLRALVMAMVKTFIDEHKKEISEL